MEQNIKDYQKIVIDHYENLTNDVDIYHQSLKQGEFDREREEITKLIEEYREKNLNQVNNVKLDIEKTKNLATFEKRELLDELIFKDECVSSIVSPDFRKILIIYPCYISSVARWSLRKRLFEYKKCFYSDLNTRDEIIVSLIINIYETTKSSIIEIGNFECENLSIWSEKYDFPVNDLAEFMKKFKIKSNNLILNPACTFMKNFPYQILSEDLNFLKKFQINHSVIAFLNDNVFSNLKDLEILEINRCNTYLINDGFLNGLIKLRELRIKLDIFDFYTKTEFPYILRPEQFKDLKNLEVLEIQTKCVNVINDSTFINLNNLVHLDLSRNYLLEILEKTFEGLKNLKVLEIQNSCVKKINDSTFKNLKNLERLDLSRNYFLKEIFAKTFEGLKNLKVLEISNASVKKINDSTFKNLKNLEHLDLSRNYLLEILEKTFEGLKNLKYLDLSNNKITSIHKNAFSDSRNLERINLSNNKIEFLFSDTFDGLTSLKYLDIKGNLLHPENYFDINGCTITF